MPHPIYPHPRRSKNRRYPPNSKKLRAPTRCNEGRALKGVWFPIVRPWTHPRRTPVPRPFHRTQSSKCPLSLSVSPLQPSWNILESDPTVAIRPRLGEDAFRGTRPTRNFYLGGELWPFQGQFLSSRMSYFLPFFRFLFFSNFFLFRISTRRSLDDFLIFRYSRFWIFEFVKFISLGNYGFGNF